MGKERFYDSQAKKKIDLEKFSTITIGRAPSCAYQVDLETELELENGVKINPGKLVSKEHATLRFDEYGVSVWDNESRYGTFLKRWAKGNYSEPEQIFTRTQLFRGDIIILGPAYEIKYLTKEERETSDNIEKNLRTGDTWVGEV